MQDTLQKYFNTEDVRNVGEEECFDKIVSIDATMFAMTVCIAAIADGGKKAVLMADKMTTMNGMLSHQIDGAATKIHKISDTVAVMYCGAISEATQIIERFKSSVGDKTLVEELATQLNQTFLEYLYEHIVNQQIIGRGIPSLLQFYNSNFFVSPDTRKIIENSLASDTLLNFVNFVICGKGVDGLYKVYYLGTNPRYLPSLYVSGYGAIGDGSTHAVYSLIFDDYIPTKSLEDVKKMVEEAKRKAEKCTTVGKESDQIVLE